MPERLVLSAAFHACAALFIPALGCTSASPPEREAPISSTQLAQPQSQALASPPSSSLPPFYAAPILNTSGVQLLEAVPDAGAEFGMALSAGPDQVLIGAPWGNGLVGNSGVAYHLERTAQAWGAHLPLRAQDGEANDRFGMALSVEGQRALVGAPNDGDIAPNAGAAYIFERSGNRWSQSAKLTVASAAFQDGVGEEVTLSGDLAVLAAPASSPVGSQSGAVHVFEKVGLNWQQTATLTPSDAAAGDEFGCSVSLRRETLLVGAYRNDAFGDIAGAAYVFERSATNWVEKQKLKASDADRFQQFGTSVDLSEAYALIGAPGDSETDTAAGAAYVFGRSAGLWVEEGKLTAPGVAADGRLGAAVSIDGATALVGAYKDDDFGQWTGAAYLYQRSASSWSMGGKLRAGDAAPEDAFGWGVSVHGELALVGARWHDTGARDAGAAYAYGTRLRGLACDADAQCTSGKCVAGFCCDARCGESCQRCDLAGQEGTCSTVTEGTVIAACGVYRCDGGDIACPQSCSGDGNCNDGHYCKDSACTPKEALGSPCQDVRACQSGFCSHGVCCEGPCAGSCQRCDSQASAGRCTLLEQGDVGSPSCVPYVCDGAQASCSHSCADNAECSSGNFCNDGGCIPRFTDGAGCSAGEACQTGLCTDGRCCIAASCAPYRCGEDGVCGQRCTSSAACVAGFECGSDGKCQVRPPEDAEAQSVGCALVGADGSEKVRPLGMSLFLLLALLRRRRGARQHDGRTRFPERARLQ